MQHGGLHANLNSADHTYFSVQYDDVCPIYKTKLYLPWPQSHFIIWFLIMGYSQPFVFSPKLDVSYRCTQLSYRIQK